MRLYHVVLCVIFMSCAQSHPDSINNEMVMVSSAEEEANPEPKTDPTKHIIKTADYKFNVENIETSTRNIEKIVSQFEGFIAGMDMRSSNTDMSNTFSIRVPANNFNALLDALGKEALFTNYKKISTQDVSEEFVDIQTRLQTKREVHDRYVDILKNKAKTVDDVLKAERQISDIQEEIEAKEGRLRYLQTKVSMSTINLEIYQKANFAYVPDAFEKPYITKAKAGFQNGWEIITGISLLLINIWPLILLTALFLWKREAIFNKLRKKTTVEVK